jgi:predicted phosphodiesterase
MTKIGLISDTHNYLDKAILKHLESCDEIWHAGDFGNIDIANRLRAIKPLKGVYGNIDSYDVRSEFSEQLLFYCEEVKVLMKHIGGYPGRYAPPIKNIIKKEQPQ